MKRWISFFCWMTCKWDNFTLLSKYERKICEWDNLEQSNSKLCLVVQGWLWWLQGTEYIYIDANATNCFWRWEIQGSHFMWWNWWIVQKEICWHKWEENQMGTWTLWTVVCLQNDCNWLWHTNSEIWSFKTAKFDQRRFGIFAVTICYRNSQAQWRWLSSMHTVPNVYLYPDVSGDSEGPLETVEKTGSSIHGFLLCSG